MPFFEKSKKTPVKAIALRFLIGMLKNNYLQIKTHGHIRYLGILEIIDFDHKNAKKQVLVCCEGNK
jgi:hypothetical protein